MFIHLRRDDADIISFSTGQELCNTSTKAFKKLVGKRAGSILAQYLNWSLQKYGESLPDDRDVSSSGHSDNEEEEESEEEDEDLTDDEDGIEFGFYF